MWLFFSCHFFNYFKPPSLTQPPPPQPCPLAIPSPKQMKFLKAEFMVHKYTGILLHVSKCAVYIKEVFFYSNQNHFLKIYKRIKIEYSHDDTDDTDGNYCTAIGWSFGDVIRTICSYILNYIYKNEKQKLKKYNMSKPEILRL